MASRPRFAIRAALVAAAIGLVAAACSSGSESVSSPSSTEAATEFLDVTVSTSDGGQLEWGSLEGQDVVLWFWAPW
ncbi:MAG: hypothetical protein ACR2NL_08495 [Acidimicrobiia bacterium]